MLTMWEINPLPYKSAPTIFFKPKYVRFNIFTQHILDVSLPDPSAHKQMLNWIQ